MTNAIQTALATLAEKHDLTFDAATRAFQIIMNGGATPAQMGAFLMGLRLKGESVDELAAGATVLRAKATRLTAPENTIDIVGTGGDARGTLNISTAAAFVVAACGVPVAKHGNRAVTSKSGAADVLRELGVNLEADVPVLERALRELNICFLYAPKFHAAMRHVAPIRQELKLRTIFNLLGPLSNPAQPKFMLLGVYSEALLEPMAEALHKLEVKRAWVVHGSDGLDELTLTGPSEVVELNDGELRRFTFNPADHGLKTCSLSALQGGDPEHNAKALRDALHGIASPYADTIALNAAAALVIAGKAADIPQALSLAKEAIASGKAYLALHKLSELSHRKDH